MIWGRAQAWASRGNFGSLALSATSAHSRIVPEAKTHAASERIEPVREFKRTGRFSSPHTITQRRILRLKISYARLRTANSPSPALPPSPAWTTPTLGKTSRKTSGPHGARVLTKRYWHAAAKHRCLPPLSGDFPSTLESSIVIRSRTVAIVWGIHSRDPSFKWHV